MTKRATVDERCEGCDVSVIERFPGDGVPAFCESCDSDFERSLRAGHVDYLGGEVVRLVESTASGDGVLTSERSAA